MRWIVMVVVALLGVALWCYGVWGQHPFAVGAGFGLFAGSISITVLYNNDCPKEKR